MTKLIVIALVVLGCGAEQEGPPSGGGGSGTSDKDCLSDNCVCPANESCEHTCEVGAPECHVRTTAPQPVDVKCRENADCRVQCEEASTCRVDCGDSASCQVTCPEAGCVVTSCVAPDCLVTCGPSDPASDSGASARCD